MVIAISGKPGSGKTTVCDSLGNTGEYLFFELGLIYRTVLCYLKENNLSNLLDSGEKLLEVLDDINISYDKSINNNLIVYVNQRSYSRSNLFGVEMDMDTVKLGGLIGDNLNYKIRPMIFDLSSTNDVVLNVRKPFTMYPELDLHIFLTALFEVRARRKAFLNNISFENASKLLLERDLMEERNGFFQISSNSKIIDTSNIDALETYKKVRKLIREVK